MDVRLKLLYFVFDLILPMAGGYLFFRRGWMSRETSDRIIVFGMAVVTPAMTLLTAWVMDLHWVLIWLPILGVLMQVIPGALGYLMARKKFDDKLDQGSFVMSAMLQNRGVVGALSVFILYGEKSYAWAQLVMGLATPVVYMFCFPLGAWFRAMHTGESSARRGLWSVIFSYNQLPMVGLIVGMILHATGPVRPAFLEGATNGLVHVTSWAFIFPLGFSIDFREMRRYIGDLVSLMGLKFIITPLLIALIGYAVGVRGEMLITAAILAAAPTAINAVIIGRLYKLNIHLTMAAFVVTTMAYIVFVFPLLLWWFGK